MDPEPPFKPQDDKKKTKKGRYGKRGKKRCKLTHTLDSSCYDQYDQNNYSEWKISMMAMWDNLGWLAIFGPLIIPTSLWMIVAPLLNDDAKPGAEIDLKVMDESDKKWLVWLSFVASMGAPSFFMFTQFFTWGESNLSDSSLLYMTNEETSLYFIYNSWWTIQHYPYALFHVTIFGCIYLF